MKEESALHRLMGACVSGDMAALFVARKDGGPELFKELSDDEKEFVAVMLSTSARNGNFEAVKEALEAGASLEWVDYFGKTPLMSILEINDCEKTSFLIGAGANVNAKAGRHGSVLEQAVVLQSVKMVELILGAGADMESCDEMGNSILMRTIGYGAHVMVEMARMFIDSGARVDAKNIQDMTALMYAAEYKTAPMVALLLASGADVDLRDCNGKSALDYASHDIRRIGKEGDGDTGSNSKECELMISSYQASQSLKTDLRLKNDAKASMAAGMGKVKVKV